MEKSTKYSRQREALLSLLKEANHHPSADWLYSELKKQFPNISLATVYRNLNLLHKKGIISRLDFGTGVELYDGNVHTHSHFICKNCRTILDLELTSIDYWNQEISDLLQAKVDTHSIVFYGICKDCL